jgi:hypothetical protein
MKYQFKYEVRISGDRDVGILPTSETVIISFETLDNIDESGDAIIKSFLEEFFDCGFPVTVLNEQELKIEEADSELEDCESLSSDEMNHNYLESIRDYIAENEE